MIFVTVGTHEQQFDRLIKHMDEWARVHEEEVVMQTGFSTYGSQNARWQNLYSSREMTRNVNNARIVISHGGPTSFIMPLHNGRIPIVVPRMEEFGEHVNDHQVKFCSLVSNVNNYICIPFEKGAA